MKKGRTNLNNQLNGESRDETFDEHQGDMPEGYGPDGRKQSLAETGIALNQDDPKQQNASENAEKPARESVQKRFISGPGEAGSKRHAERHGGQGFDQDIGAQTGNSAEMQ